MAVIQVRRGNVQTLPLFLLPTASEQGELTLGTLIALRAETFIGGSIPPRASSVFCFGLNALHGAHGLT
jgi:hypothetical protein